jgi:hypothetical protein
MARELNTGGYTLFNYDREMAEELLPALHKGITASPDMPGGYVIY